MTGFRDITSKQYPCSQEWRHCEELTCIFIIAQGFCSLCLRTPPTGMDLVAAIWVKLAKNEPPDHPNTHVF